MQNPLNVTNANPSNNAGASNKQTQAAVSGASFNQFLSREMAAAAPAATPPEAQSATPAPAAAPAAPAADNNNQQATTAASNQNDNSADAANNREQSSSTAAPIAKAGDGSQAGDGKTVAKDDSKDSAASDAADAAAPAVPVDLLALVASLNQPALKPQAAVDSSAADSIATDTASLVDVTDSAKRGLTAADLVAGGVATDKSAAPSDGATDFGAVLKDSGAVPDGAGKLPAADKKQAGIAGLADPLGTLKKTTATSSVPAQSAKVETAAAVDSGTASLTAIDTAKSSKVDDTQPSAKAGAAAKDAVQVASTKSEALAAVSGEKTLVLPETNKAALSDLSAVSAPNAALLAPTALQMNQAAALPASEKLTPAVGSPGWDQALGQKVVWMIAGGQQSATLTLNPPDLGPLQVVVHVNNDQASASFNSNQPEVRAALEAAMPKLRDMMNDAGISLASSTVGTGLPNNSQSAPNEQRQSPSSRFDTSLTNAGSDQPLRSSTARTVSSNGALGLVDTFA